MKRNYFLKILFAESLCLVLSFLVGLIASIVAKGNTSWYLLVALPMLLLLFVVALAVASILADKFHARTSASLKAIRDSIKSVNAGEYMPLQEEVKDAEFGALFWGINALNENTHDAMVWEKELAQRKSDFFANASHELKTPLTVMRGMTELLMQEEQDERRKKQLERIYKENIRLTDLISDMLKISRLERGEEKEERARVSLRETANEIAAELSQQIAEKSIRFEVEGDGFIVADGKKIFQVIQNLCANAVNYNKEGGFVRVEITETERKVVWCVKDSGIGIEKQHIPRICERFYRVDKSRSKKTGGTGLGLAIVKHVCALYGASLHIESEFGVGTTITVQFKKQ